jgi:hypothetical protein
MLPALQTWRNELSSTLVRLFAYLGGLALLSIGAMLVFHSPTVLDAFVPASRSEWIEIERPFPAFALAIPEAADQPASYAIRRHAEGGGRKDILGLGDPDGSTPYLRVEIYRPGSEISRFGDPKEDIATAAAALGPTNMHLSNERLASKFGLLSIVTFDAVQGTPRHCIGFVRDYNDPLLRLSGWFCQSGSLIERSTLACALDRLTLLSSGSDPKVGALFAKAEVGRSFCGQRDPILASTPKYKLLWKALPKRPEPRRLGR